MSYIVRELSVDLTTCFTEYLENLDFSSTPHWSTCYCRFYHTNCSGDQWLKRTGPENREEAIEQIKAGNMKGYLAFDNEKCIGWCNANDAQRYLRLEDDLIPLTRDQKVGCIICFVIHPDYRRQGVARLLLSRAVEGFKEQGFDAVVAIPIENNDEPEKLYRGTLNMYKEHGFEEIEKHDNMSVMWLKLNEE